MKETIIKIREKMNGQVDAVIIPSSDNHNSEYVATHFRTREFISGFTGSAGTVVVFKNEAGLWTDGRYYRQAELELADTGIDLFKASELDVKPYDEYIIDKLEEGSTVGINASLFTTLQVKTMIKKFERKSIKVRTDIDFANELWTDRPPIRKSDVFLLKDNYQGLTIKKKLTQLRLKLEDNTAFIISSLDSVAWLFNLRANDINNFPVAYAFGFVTQEKAYLFIDKSRISHEVMEVLEQDVCVMEYSDIEDFMTSYNKNETLLCATNVLNYHLYAIAKENENFTIVEGTDLVGSQKMIKTAIEVANMKEAYLKDGAALAEFWSFVFEEVAEKKQYTEFELVTKLASFRSEQEEYLSESFDAIIAFGENAAMMHYSPDEESPIIEEGQALLVDSGGQYQHGTTDITRTFAIGKVNPIIKKDFTLALKGIIALQEAIVLEGSTASDLDILCRQPLWKEGLDYKCGTGHGVGYVSTVHEGSVNFRYNTKQRKIEPGMILTIEPGVYKVSEHGIRTENTIVVKEHLSTEFGQFYQFENICFFPIDSDLINKELLTYEEITYINEYHQSVYQLLKERVSPRALNWLKDKCKAL